MGNTRKPILAKLPQQELDRAVRHLLNGWDMVYKVKQNKVDIYCHRCESTGTLTKEEFKQVRKSKLCPYCFETVDFHKDAYVRTNRMLYATEVDNQEVGYYIEASKRFNRKPKVFCKQVAYWYETPRGRRVFMCRNVFNGLGGWHYRTNKEIEEYGYKKGFYERSRGRYSLFGLENHFYANTDCFRLKAKTMPKKVYYNSLNIVPLKSNQQKLVEDNLFNKAQINAIRVFNLKRAEDVLKYSNWINNQSFTQYEKRELNIYYLDYLVRNKISYVSFRDYMNQCEELNMKYEKPKDFAKVHEQLSRQLEAKNNAKYDKRLMSRYKNLSTKETLLKGLKIKPLESSLEIINVAHELHNCMASNYLVPYAKGKTDLYAVYENDIAIIGIEVLKGKLEQVRAKYNYEPKPKYKKIVKEWYKNAYAR